MKIEEIVKLIDGEIDRLEQAKRMLLGAAEPAGQRKRGRPKKSETAVKTASTKPRRTLSAKARKAIADAQRKRWAAKKTTSKAS